MTKNLNKSQRKCKVFVAHDGYSGDMKVFTNKKSALIYLQSCFPDGKFKCYGKKTYLDNLVDITECYLEECYLES